MEHELFFNLPLYLAEEEGGIYSYRTTDSEVKLFTFGDCYVKQIEPDYPNMVCTQLSFSKEDLSLKEKGQYLKHGYMDIGVWETYDESGQVCHTENKDRLYPLAWHDVEQILEDNKISLLTAYSINRYIDTETNKPIWSIGIKISETTGLLHIIDAQTGEILSRETTDLRRAL